MKENEEQAETFNQDQQEMFQNPDTHLGETRPRTPGTQSIPPSLEAGEGTEQNSAQGEGKVSNVG